MATLVNLGGHFSFAHSIIFEDVFILLKEAGLAVWPGCNFIWET